VNRDEAGESSSCAHADIYINGRHFELEQFNLLEDVNDWIELEIEQRTGTKVAARKVDVPAASGASRIRCTPDGSARAPAKRP